MAKGKTCRADGCENPARADGALCTTCHKGNWRKRVAARRDAAEHDYQREEVPEGYHLKGISELRGADGEVKLRWIKSAADADTRLLHLRDAMMQIGEELPRAQRVDMPRGTDEDLLCVYPMGDPHLGMYSWAQETGADFDLTIAERELIAAVDHLVDIAPPAKQAAILNLGDFFHADSPENRTARSGHALDVDTRWPKVLATGIRVMRRIVDRALEKHERVTVICEIGNHDDNSAIMLALCLAAYYEREPRVEVDTSPAKFHWIEFGKCLLGVTHGDGLKRESLPGIMANDKSEVWGRTEFRHWYTGHVHHEQVKEFPGVTWESFRTLAPRDAWHARAGYRSGQDMRCDIWHREWGRVGRHLVSVQQVRALLARPQTVPIH